MVSSSLEHQRERPTWIALPTICPRPWRWPAARPPHCRRNWRPARVARAPGLHARRRQRRHPHAAVLGQFAVLQHPVRRAVGHPRGRTDRPGQPETRRTPGQAGQGPRGPAGAHRNAQAEPRRGGPEHHRAEGRPRAGAARHSAAHPRQVRGQRDHLPRHHGAAALRGKDDVQSCRPRKLAPDVLDRQGHGGTELREPGDVQAPGLPDRGNGGDEDPVVRRGVRRGRRGRPGGKHPQGPGPHQLRQPAPPQGRHDPRCAPVGLQDRGGRQVHVRRDRARCHGAKTRGTGEAAAGGDVEVADRFDLRPDLLQGPHGPLHGLQHRVCRHGRPHGG